MDNGINMKWKQMFSSGEENKKRKLEKLKELEGERNMKKEGFILGNEDIKKISQMIEENNLVILKMTNANQILMEQRKNYIIEAEEQFNKDNPTNLNEIDILEKSLYPSEIESIEYLKNKYKRLAHMR